MNWEIQCPECETLLRLPADMIEALDKDGGIEDLKLGDVREIRCVTCAKAMEICLDSEDHDCLIVSKVLTNAEARSSELLRRLVGGIVGTSLFVFGVLSFWGMFKNEFWWLRIPLAISGIVFIVVGLIFLALLPSRAWGIEFAELADNNKEKKKNE